MLVTAPWLSSAVLAGSALRDWHEEAAERRRPQNVEAEWLLKATVRVNMTWLLMPQL